MKTLEQIIKSEAIYLNNWSNKMEVVADFNDIYMGYEEYKNGTSEWTIKKRKEINELLNGEYKDINILFATYGYENYSGDAFVLFEENGELYEVNGGHCSCFGLEDQWEPDKVSLNELEHRLLNGTFGQEDYAGNEFKKELCEFLGVEYIIQ